MKRTLSDEKQDSILPLRMCSSKHTKTKRLDARTYTKLFIPWAIRQSKVAEFMDHGDKQRKCGNTLLVVDGTSKSTNVNVDNCHGRSHDIERVVSTECLCNTGNRERDASVKGIQEAEAPFGCKMTEESLQGNEKETGERLRSNEREIGFPCTKNVLQGMESNEGHEMEKQQPDEESNSLEAHASTESLPTSRHKDCPIEGPLLGQLSTSQTETLVSIVSNGDHLPQVSDENKSVSNDGTQACVVQENLHELLKIELSKVCDAMLFPKNVMDAAAISLEYVMTSCQIQKKSDTMLQALLLSLCWISSSILKHDFGHKASILFARRQLQFTCKTKEVKSMYRKLCLLRRHLKKKIMCRPAELINFSQSSPHKQASKEGPRSFHSSIIAHAEHQEIVGTTGYDFRNDECLQDVFLDKEQTILNVQVATNVPCPVINNGDVIQQNENNLETTTLIKLDSVKKKRLWFIYRKQREEFADFAKFKEMEATKLFTEYGVKHSDILQDSDSSIREKKLNSLCRDISLKEANLRNQMKMFERALKDRHEEMRERENQTYSHWLKEAKAGRSVEPYFALPLPDICFKKELLLNEVQVLSDKTLEKFPQNGSGNKCIISLPSNTLKDSCTILSVLDASEGRDHEVYESLPDNSSINNILNSLTALEQHNSPRDSTTFERSPEVQLANRPLSTEHQKQGDEPSISREMPGMEILIPMMQENSKNDPFLEQNIPSSDIADKLCPKLRHGDSQETRPVAPVNPGGRSASAKACREHGHVESLRQAELPVRQSLQAFPPIEQELEHPNLPPSPMHAWTASSLEAGLANRPSSIGLANPTNTSMRLTESETISQSSPVTAVDLEPSVLIEPSGTDILFPVIQEKGTNDSLLRESSSSSQVADRSCPDLTHADLRGAHLGEVSVQHPLGIFTSSAKQDMGHLPLERSIMKLQILSSPEVGLSNRPLSMEPQEQEHLDVRCMKSETLVQSNPCNAVISETILLPVFPQSRTDGPLLQQGGSGSQIADGLCPNLRHGGSQGTHLVSFLDPSRRSVDMEREHGYVDAPLQVEISVPQQLGSIGASSEHGNLPLSQSITNSQMLPSPVDIGESTFPVDGTARDIYLDSSINISLSTTFFTPTADDGDPLNHEILRLSKEEEQTEKLHEEKKVHIDVQCDKLVEDVTRKYLMRIHDENARHLQVKGTLEDNMEKVMLQLLLAEAFRIQLTDYKKMHSTMPLGSSTTQEGPEQP